jgi:hypothetical protein
MWRGARYAILLLAAACVPAHSGAMSSAQRPCHVAGDAKFAAPAGGASAICDAVERAIAAQAPKLQYSAEVQILSKSALKAKVMSDGREVAQQQLSVMDRNLNPDSIERFAKLLAEQVAKATRS